MNSSANKTRNFLVYNDFLGSPIDSFVFYEFSQKKSNMVAKYWSNGKDFFVVARWKVTYFRDGIFDFADEQGGGMARQIFNIVEIE